jgi:RHS repeat-associated protein
VETYLATLEPQQMEEEESQFINYEEGRYVQSELFDHTYHTGPGYAQRLSGTAQERIGLVKSLKVSPGDKVSAQVYAKYVDPDTQNWNTLLADLMAAIAAGGAPTVVDGAAYGDGGTYPFASLLDRPEVEDGPKAYLNWLVFDEDMHFLLGESGYSRLTTAAREAGSNEPHELLLMAEKEIKVPGYVYIYLSNEEEAPLDVYFDDFKVSQVQSPILQETFYYPFGAVASSYQRENSLPNRHLYQGKEWQTELDLGWYDFHARQYDPWTVTTTTQDPLAERYYSFSPYSWVAGNPVVFTDPTGMWIDWSHLNRDERKVFRQALKKHESSGTYKNLYQELKKSDNKYVLKATYDEGSAGGSFDGNKTITMDGPPDELTGATESLTVQTGDPSLFKQGEMGGVISLNFGLVEDGNFSRREKGKILGDLVVEEVIHAAQYERTVNTAGNNNSSNFQPSANTEFEAKAIVGQVQKESRRSLYTAGHDKIANAYGVQAFQNRNISGYHDTLRQWHSQPNLPSYYKRGSTSNSMPGLLLHLIKRK